MSVGNTYTFRLSGVCRFASLERCRIASLAAAMTIGLTLGFPPQAVRAQDIIKIGVPVPLSGSYRGSGTDIVDGAKLAVAQINAGGGVLGKQLELMPQDDACNPDEAANAANRLITAGVVAVVGGYCSSAALPELRVLHEVNIPFVLDASAHPALTSHGWQDVFRTIGRSDKQGGYVASLMKDLLHAKRAAVINDGTTYSQGLAQSTVAALKQDGVEVVYDNAITPGQKNYRDVVQAAADSKPDVLYFTGYYTEAAVLAANLREVKPTIKHFMGNGTADPSLIAHGGAAVEGMIVTTSPLPQFMTSQGARRYVKAYEAAYQQAPGPYSIYEYDAVGVTARAIKDAKSTKPEDITAALHKLKRYDGATGEIAFDEKGDRTKPTFMAVTVRHGKFEPYASLDGKGRWVAMK
ncbi:branched-chain amino acid ABC transporter substrate-binding protein [Trinickia acidisoli]|uniref:branched-chain amino acid ABC transporter substrate-binding protein n=1 Tax=Trinickia acidisoli TaxID=2767482 RepID=UPI001A9000E9|nr:branched-chain amino acid ABC transporter substrate-binding protein [Trinickia acidisoli]